MNVLISLSFAARSCIFGWILLDGCLSTSSLRAISSLKRFQFVWPQPSFQFIFSTALDGKIKAWLYDCLGSRVDYDAPGLWCTTMAYSADGTRWSCIDVACLLPELFLVPPRLHADSPSEYVHSWHSVGSFRVAQAKTANLTWLSGMRPRDLSKGRTLVSESAQRVLSSSTRRGTAS